MRIMKIKNILSLLVMLGLLMACSEEQYEIPRDEQGNVIFTYPSETQTVGISTLDQEFTVTAQFYNSNSGDKMEVELLQLQGSHDYNTDQNLLLPLDGTQKEVTLDDDLKASVTYTRDDANLNESGDYVVVVFSGETDYAKQRVTLVNATNVTEPMVGETVVTPLMRMEDTAYFNVTVEPKSDDYTGELVVKRKNAYNETWTDIPESPLSGDQPFLVPISGSDYAADKDTMYYQFTTEAGSYADVVERQIVVSNPYFFVKRSATITPSQCVDLFTNVVADTANVDVAPDDMSALVSISSVSGLLKLQGNSEWLAASGNNTIEFVPSTLERYETNNSNASIADFEAGVAAGDETTTADPLYEEGVYVFKVVNGTASEDTYYGMVKFTTSSTESVEFEYRIGNMYAHISIVQ